VKWGCAEWQFNTESEFVISSEVETSYPLRSVTLCGFALIEPYEIPA
jgi:hypothetical protein